MNSSSELPAIKAIREALKVVEARGVNLKLYKAELLLLQNLAWYRQAMKVMFAKNELTWKIMTYTMINRTSSIVVKVFIRLVRVRRCLSEANMKGISI